MQSLKDLVFTKRYRLLGHVFSIFEIAILLLVTYYVIFQRPDTIYQLIVLIFAVTVHEAAHAFAANRLGDPTAKALGRLSLNPLAHIDIMGSVILPGLLLLSGSGFLIGWAKPVPVQSQYFKRPLQDMMWVALAGPISNIIMAVIAAVVFRYAGGLSPSTGSFLVLAMAQYAIVINLVLAVFNMVPIPPLDGSRVLAFFLPESARYSYYRLEQYGFFIVIILALTGVFSWILQWTIPPMINLLLG